MIPLSLRSGIGAFWVRLIAAAYLWLATTGETWIFGTAASAATPSGQTPSRQSERSPNILFILADDLGIHDLHSYGRADHRTPHLDRLASEGVRFTSAYCAQPICSPSRAAIMTGRSPTRLHLTTYLPGRPDCAPQKLLHPKIEQRLPLSERTLAEILKHAGYATALIGKWHLGGHGFLPTDQGFDLYHPGSPNTTPSETEGGKGEYDLTRRAEAFIEANKQKPFFLFLSHNSPHIPYTAKTPLSDQNSKAFEPVYAALIETLDDSVGRVLSLLDRLGLGNDTLILFTSDNGGLHVPELNHAKITSNAPFRAGKGFLYEGGLRIPLIVRWPGHVPAGRVLDIPVTNTDWLPTLLELAHLAPARNIDGQSFAPLLLGRKKSSEQRAMFGVPRLRGRPGERSRSSAGNRVNAELQTSPSKRRLYWHFPHYTNQGGQPAGAMRDGPWKLIEHYETGRLELFNLDKDQGELTDLSQVEAKRAQKMRGLLHAWIAAAGGQTNAPNPTFDATLHKRLYEDIDMSRFDPLRAGRDEMNRTVSWRKLMDKAVRPSK